MSLIRALLIIALASYTTSALAESSCFKTAKKLGSRQNVYVGYGRSLTPEAAVMAARADLAGQIQTQVSVVIRDQYAYGERLNTYDAQSEISETLADLKVIDRCQQSDGWYEAVIKLSKQQFLDMQQARIERLNERSKQIILRFAKAEAPAMKFTLLNDARELQEANPGAFFTLDTCISMKGCKNGALKYFQELSTLMNKFAKFRQFKFVAQDDEARLAEHMVTRLLNASGVQIVNGDAKAVGEAQATCRQNVFPKSQQFTYRMVEVICHVDGMVEGHKVFSKGFTGKGMDNDLSIAVEMAREKLETDASH